MPTAANIGVAQTVQTWITQNKQDPDPRKKAAVGLANQFLQVLHELNSDPGTPHGADTAAQAAYDARQPSQISRANYAVTGRR